MKSYTDLEQSKILAKFLPPESADMTYVCIDICKGLKYMPEPRFIKNIPDHADEYDVNAWSLAALLNYLREIDFFPSIEADEHSVTMSVCYYDEKEGRLLNPVHDINVEAETFIDACYELICKLHEQNIL